MKYVMMLSWKPDVTREQADAALAMRAAWQYPEGINVLGEYWLATGSPAVITIFEATDYEPIMEINLTWNDAFDITTVPATTPEEGLAMGQRIMQRRPE